MTKVELFEAIRRDARVHGRSIRQIARERGIHRRMVRQALSDAVPPPRRATHRTPPVLTEQMREQIDTWLRADKQAPRKQRHTARRIWQRLRAELDFVGAESTVRRVVSQRRRALGLGKEAFVPLSHRAGEEAEVDWYEAQVQFSWGLETMQFFAMRACSSGREFHIAFPRQTQQAFLEAHVAAFAHFGGVFETLRYDNLKAAVTRVLRGRRRIESDRFVALRSHYLFASQFCIPGIKGAHEKGGVEGGLGRFRRNHLVPVPCIDDLTALNRLLLDGCAQDDLRRIEGRTQTIIEDWAEERKCLQPLPSEPLSTADVDTALVNSKGMISVRTNRYSVPIRLAHLRVEYRLHATRLEVVHDGRVVAQHPRLQGHHEVRVELDHYLELLWRKPGALSRSLPLKQARERAQWPVIYDEMFVAMQARFEPAEAARQMLAVLMLHRESSAEAVEVAVSLALEHGCHDAGAIAVLLRQLQSDEADLSPLENIGELLAYDRPMSTLDDYDSLLGGGAVH